MTALLSRRRLPGLALAAAAIPHPGYADTGGLAELAEARGLLLGTMTVREFARDTPQLLPLIRQDAKLLTSGWEFQWGHVQPRPGEFHFEAGEAMVELAARELMPLRAHCLIWHEGLPEGFDLGSDPATARAMMTDHISQTCRHFAGRINSWVVVNEPLMYLDHQPGNLANTPFYRAIGPDYIRIALEAAAEADPGALLLINEYNVEQQDSIEDTQRVMLLDLLEKLRRQGAPLHALGIQGHLKTRSPPFNPERLRKFIRDVASLGLEVHITELDVVDKASPGNVLVRDREVADLMYAFMEVVLSEPAVTTISTWGLDDLNTWMNFNKYTRRADSLPARGQLYDGAFQRKPAWEAMARALRDVPVPAKFSRSWPQR